MTNYSTAPGQPHDGNTVCTAAEYDFLQPAQGPDELGRLGSFRVLQPIGSGGMGLVFRAEDICLQRMVALKVRRPTLGAGVAGRQRFLREARAAAAFRHDHIVTIYQVGQENGVPFLAMELLAGETLESRLDRVKQLPLRDALRIGRETAEGLAAAHARGLIHRDVKPSNLFLEERRDRVKILDFGLARDGEEPTDLTPTGLVVGTPRYMSPEQARGEEVDHRTDLFSLGCVLYRMISGRSAFRGNDPISFLTSLAVDDPKPLSEFDSSVPPAAAQLVSRLLAKNPGKRPESAQLVVAAIMAIERRLDCDEAESQCASVSGRVPETRAYSPRPKWRGLRLVVQLGALFALIVGTSIPWITSDGRRASSQSPHSKLGVACDPSAEQPIKVGVLHSLSGTLSESGSAVTDATLLAIDEINEAGGLLGRRVEAVVRDGQSTPEVYARQAEKLIVKDKVCTIFGCWSSDCRKTIKPIVEKHDHLLVYPVQYEGLEESPNIVYNGAAPNQQIIPAVRYCAGFLGKRRFFLVGSDYVFPRTANAIIHDELKRVGAKVVGEEYLLMGSADVGGIVKRIAAAKPDMILSTINGDSNRPFFRALRAAGITPDKIPTVSFSISENELRSLNAKDMAGDYAAWNYFQSLDHPENVAFLRSFHAKFGPHRVTSDPMEAAYFGVHLWARAVEKAGSDDVGAIRAALRTQRFKAPEGEVRIDPATGHTWKTIRLGRFTERGQFNIIWSSVQPIKPEPFPNSRSREEWERFLQAMSEQWSGHWTNPGR